MKEYSDNLTLRYFDIAWFSRYDGPGHRVVLYLQGCHLRCPWCHSPHSQLKDSLLLYFPARCRLCGRCEQVCQYGVHKITSNGHFVYRNRCVRCGKCVNACPVSSNDNLCGALVLSVKEVTLSSLWHLLYPQLDLVRTIGGLTVSGGEALLQSEALAGLLSLCKKEGIHTAVETSGALPAKYVKEVSNLTDCWLYGLRPTPFYIPPHAEQITRNLAFLSKTESRIIIRTPIISGITDTTASLNRIAEIMQDYGLSEIQLLPFNPETSHYYNAIGKKCGVGDNAIVSSECMESVRTFFLKKNISATIIQ